MASLEQISSLEQMMKLFGKSEYEPDHALIQSAMSKAYLMARDDILTGKLNSFTDAYLKMLNKSDTLKLLEFLKMRLQEALPSERVVLL